VGVCQRNPKSKASALPTFLGSLSFLKAVRSPSPAGKERGERWGEREGGRKGGREREGGGAVMLAIRRRMPHSSSEVPAYVSACCCNGAVYRFTSFTSAARYRRTYRLAAVYRFASFTSTVRLRRGFTLALLALRFCVDAGRLWQATSLRCQGAALSKNAM
jgi:hypothetical protein